MEIKTQPQRTLSYLQCECVKEKTEKHYGNASVTEQKTPNFSPFSI
jgi:hypothetical protein